MRTRYSWARQVEDRSERADAEEGVREGEVGDMGVEEDGGVRREGGG